MNDINITTTEKKASPIKTHEEIERIKLIFMKEENKTNDRHLLYFILGTNICLKPLELINLKWIDIINIDTGIIKDYITYKQYKFYLNLSCKNAIRNYINKYNFYKVNKYVFGVDVPISIAAINKTYRGIEKLLNLNYSLSSLSLHKTFVYWQIKNENSDYIKMSKLKELCKDTEISKSINHYAEFNFDNDYIYINNVNL